MAVNGELSVDFEMKSRANNFFNKFIKLMEDLPEENARVKIEFIPSDEEKKITYRMSGINISAWYKKIRESIEKDTWQNPDLYGKLEGTMTVTHKKENDRDDATLTMEYEKTSPDIEDPKSIMDSLVKYVKQLDEFLKRS